MRHAGQGTVETAKAKARARPQKASLMTAVPVFVFIVRSLGPWVGTDRQDRPSGGSASLVGPPRGRAWRS